VRKLFAQSWPETGFNISLLLTMKRYKEALEEYDKAIKIDPNYPDYRYGKGTVLLSSGRYREALQETDKALKLEPDNPLYSFQKTTILNSMKSHKTQ